MNVQKLKSELATDPAAYGYAGMTPAQMSAALNAADKLGGTAIVPLPMDRVLLWAGLRGVFGKLDAVTTANPAYSAARAALLRIQQSAVGEIDLGNSGVQTLLGILVSNAVITADDRDSLLALATVALTRAQAVDGSPTAYATFDDIAAAR